MILHDGKKAAGVILSKMDSSGMDKPISEPSDHEDLKAIAADMFHAIEKKDPHLLVVALKAFMGCIEEADEEQDSEEMR